jgi:hypothetical protein
MGSCEAFFKQIFHHELVSWHDRPQVPPNVAYVQRNGCQHTKELVAKVGLLLAFGADPQQRRELEN